MALNTDTPTHLDCIFYFIFKNLTSYDWKRALFTYPENCCFVDESLSCAEDV